MTNPASYEMLMDTLKAWNRGREYPSILDEIREIFPAVSDENPVDILGEVESLLELIDDGDNELQIRLGDDDTRHAAPPNPDATIHEDFSTDDWRVTRTDNAIFVFPLEDEAHGAGPVVFWLTPLPGTENR